MKAFGIMFAFFGMIATLAAGADITTGRYDVYDPAQLLRGLLWVLAGVLLFALGVILLKRDRTPA